MVDESFKNNDTKELLNSILEELKKSNETQSDALTVLRQIHVQLDKLNR